MSRISIAVLWVLALIYVVPFLIYSAFSALGMVTPPEDISPIRFLLSILISKAGTALVFVLIFYLARNTFHGRWLLYGLLWWLMFITGEVGQAMGPDYTWPEAIAGMIAETLYCPLAAVSVDWLIGVS